MDFSVTISFARELQCFRLKVDHHLCRCVFFFLFLLKKQQHLQRAKKRGGGEALQWCGEERSQTKMQRENLLQSVRRMLQQSIYICPDDFRRVGTVVGRRFSLINIQSFQEFFLKTKIDSLLQNLAVYKRSQSPPGFCVCDAIGPRDTEEVFWRDCGPMVHTKQMENALLPLKRAMRHFATANCIWRAAKTQVHTVQRCASKHHHKRRRLHFCPQYPPSCKNLEGLRSSYSETMQINSSTNEGQKTRWSWLVNKTHKDNKQVMIGHRTVTGSPQNYKWLRIMV